MIFRLTQIRQRVDEGRWPLRVEITAALTAVLVLIATLLRGT